MNLQQQNNKVTKNDLVQQAHWNRKRHRTMVVECLIPVLKLDKKYYFLYWNLFNFLMETCSCHVENDAENF